MLIIKIGGGGDINVPGIIADLSEITESCIIVHGANAIRDELGRKLNIKKRIVTSISGYSSVFSDQETIDLQMMAYAGLRNKQIVQLCQQMGLNAVGLCGLDGRVISGCRNAGIRIREAGKKMLLRDLSGKPSQINKSLLDLLIKNGYLPVLSVPIVDENGTAINSENDDIINTLQASFQAQTVVQLIEAQGILADPQDPDTLLKNLTAAELKRLENRMEARMKRKILALVKLTELGDTTVYVGDGRVENPLKDALAGKGSTIR